MHKSLAVRKHATPAFIGTAISASITTQAIRPATNAAPSIPAYRTLVGNKFVNA